MSILGRNFFVMALAMAGLSVTVMGFCGDGSVDSGDCLDPSLCCSEYGWCGTTDDHCNPATCVSGPNCPNDGGGGSGEGTCADGSVGNGVCGNGECCSEYGWCGTTDDHCSGGSTSGTSGTGQDLYSGSGAGTYYYDVTGLECNGIATPENDGYPSCTSYDPALWKTMQEYDTNNIVAIDRNLLFSAEGRASLCGKQIEVYKDGVEVPGGPYFVFDGCEACEGGGRIDFSLSALDVIDNGNACLNGVVPGITWKVTDNQILPYIP